MSELNGVYRHYTTRAEVASPILVSVLVIYSILQIVWQQVFELYRCHEVKIHLWVPPKFSGGEYKSDTYR
jgi:hypothetical protein